MSRACRVIEGGECEVTQYYHSQHHGMDLVGKNYTTNWIVAHSAGTVVAVLNSCNYNTYPNGPVIYGNYVKIRHDDGYYTMYGHLKYNTVQVSVGQRVEQGERLGYMGNTGYSTGAHLHWEVRNTSDTKIDPEPYLNADLPGTPTPQPTGTYYEVNTPDGLWLLDANKNKIKAYAYKTEVKYLGPGYDAYGYHYLCVQVVNDGAMGYMASEYLTPVPDPEPTPTPTPTPDLQVGDTVIIRSTGKGDSYGSTNTAYGIGWTRQILNIYEGRPYPYQVGNETGTTGFYKADALEKI